MLTTVTRPLSASEKRLLQARITGTNRQITGYIRTQFRVSGFFVLLGIVGGALAWRFHSAEYGLITLASVSMISLYLFGSIPFFRRQRLRDAERYRAALHLGVATALRCEASGFVVLEEEEDEGAQYAFQVAPSKILFLAGQHLYPSATFPCLSFEMITAGDPGHPALFEEISAFSPKAKPIRTIARAAKARLAVPEHRAVIAGTLDELERILQDSP